MKPVSELSAADAGKTIRIFDESREATGTLKSVSFTWSDGVWPEADSALTRVTLGIESWKLDVSPHAFFEFVDSQTFLTRIWADQPESALISEARERSGS